MKALNLIEIIAASDIDAPDMEAARHRAILTALKLRGYSMGRVSRELGLVRGSAMVVNRRPYPLVEAKIAEVLGVEASQLWPDRYDADGSPKRQRPNAAFSRPEFRKSS